MANYCKQCIDENITDADEKIANETILAELKKEGIAPCKSKNFPFGKNELVENEVCVNDEGHNTYSTGGGDHLGEDEYITIDD